MTIFIKQKDAMDCGNTCLSMIARFYGIQLNGDSLSLRQNQRNEL